jgi:hypothetical protein
MRRFFFAAFAAVLLLSSAVHARPISYPGGWTVMTINDFAGSSLDATYTITPKWSAGVRHEYYRGARVSADTAQVNYLLRRWNNPGSQANLYLQGGAGVAYKNGGERPTANAGLAADWETRRWFLSYENRFFTAGNLDQGAHQAARIGIAPYIADYGGTHTWLMLQADYYTNEDKRFSVTPLVRVFKGNDLAEFGVNLRGGVLFHYMHTF